MIRIWPKYNVQYLPEVVIGYDEILLYCHIQINCPYGISTEWFQAPA